MKTSGWIIHLGFALLLGLSGVKLSAATQYDIVGPPGSGEFGKLVAALPNGSFVVTDPGFDLTSPAVANVGAVYLFRPGGEVVSTLVGSQANDAVGSGGVTVLANGNFVVRSPNWKNGGAAQAGAATWGSAETGFLGGASVAVSAANSLVGSQASDQVGSNGVSALTNGNYVVASPLWDNGGVQNAGAATWGNGAMGTTGAVSALNSLVGSQASDQVSISGVTALTNGNYVVRSPYWNNGGLSSAGAATWGNGAAGIAGVVSAGNSLVGSHANDLVGLGGVTALTNGNYVVSSPIWKGATGAATWGNGATGTMGAVSSFNSLVGTNINEKVGLHVTALANGNYVVSSPNWELGIFLPANIGAVTWGNGATGIVGAVSPDNSLVGSQSYDQVGFGGVTALANGHYVVSSRFWDNGGVAEAGAVTWGNGTTGIVGAVSPANSLVGSQMGDEIGGDGVTALVNGNYVVSSSHWDNGAEANAGAVTWAKGATGIVGVVSTSNSLVGSRANDQVGYWGVAALANGNYVVNSPQWSNGTVNMAGAVTWGNGLTGIRGTVSAANSLVGSQAEDQVGGGTFSNYDNVTALANGNYVVRSLSWDNGAVVDAGAVTWCNGAAGIKGVVSAANSLVGSQPYDRLGYGGLTALANGNYVVRSSDWDNGPVVNAGAVTLGDGANGTVGPVNRAHSILGTAENGGGALSHAHNPVTGQLIVGQPNANRVTLLGNYFPRLLARRGEAVPGSPDVFFAKAGGVAVNAPGVALFETTLSGAGAANGRNRGLFFMPQGLPGPPWFLFQSGIVLNAPGSGLPDNAQVTGFFGPLTQHLGRGVFQITLKGTGLNSLNNRMLLADNNPGFALLWRTGVPAGLLGGGDMRSFREVLQNPLNDQILLGYQLRVSAATGVNGGNDTGLLTLRHDGSVIGSTEAREGQPAFGGGIFGQFTGRAAVSPFSNMVHFATLVKNGGSSVQGIFEMQENGSNGQKVAATGDAAPGAPPGLFSSFPALGSQNGQALFKGLLKGVPSITNEGLWRGSTLLLREGDGITSLPGVQVSSIVRFWPAGTGQVVAQVKLKGAGVNSGNNQALVLRQLDGQHLVLARTGESLPGIGAAAIRSIVAVEVNPLNGAYALLTTLKGSPSSRNLALWGGRTVLGDDTTLQALRLPVLQLRKGDTYGTPQKPLGVVRSISLKPVVDRTGAGGRGLAQVVGFIGDVAVTLTGDRRATELVLLPGS